MVSLIILVGFNMVIIQLIVKNKRNGINLMTLLFVKSQKKKSMEEMLMYYSIKGKKEFL